MRIRFPEATTNELERIAQEEGRDVTMILQKALELYGWFHNHSPDKSGDSGRVYLADKYDATKVLGCAEFKKGAPVYHLEQQRLDSSDVRVTGLPENQ